MYFSRESFTESGMFHEVRCYHCPAFRDPSNAQTKENDFSPALCSFSSTLAHARLLPRRSTRSRGLRLRRQSVPNRWWQLFLCLRREHARRTAIHLLGRTTGGK